MSLNAKALMLLVPRTPQIKMLRLKRGARYVIALEGQDGLLLPTSFWTVEQALVAYGLPCAL